MGLRTIVFALICLLALPAFVGCDKPGRCDVKLSESCTVQCKRRDGDKICTDTLVLSRAGTNAILQQKSRSVVIESLGSERCVSATDGKITDTNALESLMKACEVALEKGEPEPSAPPM